MELLLNVYRSLGRGEKLLFWAVAVAIVVAILDLDGADFVLFAQVAAAAGTLGLAGLAYAQVRELRLTRVSQERPIVVVDMDFSGSPQMYVVVRNFGRGAAQNIEFQFSHPLFSSPIEFFEGPTRRVILSEELSYFREGLAFLAPGSEVPCYWGNTQDLIPRLREEGLERGIDVVTRYRDLVGAPFETRTVLDLVAFADRMRLDEQ